MPEEASTTGFTAVPSVMSPDVSHPRQTPSFLNTIIVKLQANGKTAQARAILDSGSGVSMISETLASTLKLQRFSEPMEINGLLGQEHSKFSVVAELHSDTQDFTSRPITFTVVSKLRPVQPPSNRERILNLPQVKTLTLSDPQLGGAVDLLIGNLDIDDCVFDGSMRIDRLKLINSPFGWSIAGPLSGNAATSTLTASAAPDNLQHNLAKPWEMDQVPDSKCLPPEDSKIIADFISSHQRIEGRYMIQLPRRPDPPSLGNTRRQALRRLLSNEKTLTSKHRLKEFQDVLREYITLGHAEVIPPSEIGVRPHFYLPVHVVFKDSSSTTKLRAVFDASAKSSTGVSLNDTLMPGPNLYPALQDILLRFRQHKIGLSADISKMFREVILHPGDRDLHRFIMRDEAGNLVDCRMTRLTFGITSSPFAATQVLRLLAESSSSSYPIAARAILSDFYVDDFLAGADTIEEADHLRSQLCDLLATAGMTLRKWRTNSAEMQQRIPNGLLESCPLALQAQGHYPKALGIHWDVDNDMLHISTPISAQPEVVTKRVIASGMAGVFDVLGVFAPAIVPARILLQDLWRTNLSWDDVVPDEVQTKWNLWLEHLPAISEFAIPRRLSNSDSPTMFQSLHGFADASSYAYGAAVYVRRVHLDNTTTVTLVTAKARALPIKHITIPKAELLAALLMVRLLVRTAKLLDVPIASLHAWSDSEIVLHWLSKDIRTLEKFVANRVDVITETLPPNHWRHVKSADNPADLASRGLHAKLLINSSLWWKGPPWLSLPPDQWPIRPLSKPKVKEVPVSCLTVTPIHPHDPDDKPTFTQMLWKHYSSFHHLSRVVAWIYRFFHNCRLPAEKRLHSDVITSTEVSDVKPKLYRLSQLEHYSDVFQLALKGKLLARTHQLHRFVFTISKHGHLLINTRIRDPTSSSSPTQLTLLSLKSHLTQLLLQTLHVTYSHAGPRALMSIISSSYYMPGLFNRLKQISKTCPTCQRAYARPLQQQMGLLPLSRTTPAPPFDNTGVDFAGPFTLRLGHTRKPTYVKTYACLFVCMATMAIHIELCASLSTDDFLAALKRFIARRGCPSNVFSDNGTNFVGAREEIREIQSMTLSKDTTNSISHLASQSNIKWHHIPPRAPHFGGLWEAGVKAMKSLLRKILTPQPLRFEEMTTVLAEVEAILNSRPMTPLYSEDLQESSYLSSGHFLIGRPLRAPPTHQPPPPPPKNHQPTKVDVGEQTDSRSLEHVECSISPISRTTIQVVPHPTAAQDRPAGLHQGRDPEIP